LDGGGVVGLDARRRNQLRRARKSNSTRPKVINAVQAGAVVASPQARINAKTKMIEGVILCRSANTSLTNH
jgi:hypothetical protein